jgi:hypothetical protein
MESSCDGVADSQVTTEAELLWSEQSPPTSLPLLAAGCRFSMRRDVAHGGLRRLL